MKQFEATAGEIEVMDRLKVGDKISINALWWKEGIKYKWGSDNTPVERSTFWSAVERIKGVGHNAPEFFTTISEV